MCCRPPHTFGNDRSALFRLLHYHPRQPCTNQQNVHTQTLTGVICNAEIAGPGVSGDGAAPSPMEERSMAARPGLLWWNTIRGMSSEK